MAIWRVNNSTELGGEVCAPWTTGHAYALGARVVCRPAYATVARRAYVFECTTAGTSHAATEPTWPTSGTVADNDIVWTLRNPNDGDWNNASCILYYVLNHTAIAAGDLVYVDDGHSESILLAANVAYVIKGSTTKNNPIKILCVDKASDVLSSGAVIDDPQTNTIYSLQFSYYGYSYGVQYKSATNISASSGVLSSWMIETAPGGKILGIAASRLFASAAFTGCEFILAGDIEFLAVSASISTVVPIIWRNGSVVAASGVTSLITVGTAQSTRTLIKNVDLNAVGDNILVTCAAPGNNIIFERCKLPASFTPLSGVLSGYDQTKVKLHHCDSGNTTYSFYEESYCGSVQDETTIVRTGGASDGTTPISQKLVSSANTKELVGYAALSSLPVTIWNTFAVEKTFTVELVHDSATALQDDEIWLELEYPANGTDGLGVVASSQCLQLGTPADIPDSSETWTTTGLTNPNTRKLSVTVTPGKAGPVTARVFLAKASTTVYVDPMITVS